MLIILWHGPFLLNFIITRLCFYVVGEKLLERERQKNSMLCESLTVVQSGREEKPSRAQLDQLNVLLIIDYNKYKYF